MIKAARPCRANGLWCCFRLEPGYLLALSFSGAGVAAEELELEEGWLLVLGGVLDVAPAPAEPVVDLSLEELEDDAPPALFFSSLGTGAGAGVAPELDEDAEPEGLLGGSEVEPDEELAPEDGVLVSRAVRGALLSPQAAKPRARDTAAARIESFMSSPPWLG